MKIKDINIVFIVLIINALASILTYYFEPGTLNPGTLRGAFVSLFLVYFIFMKLRFNRINALIVFYLIYLLILALLSSNPIISVYEYIGVFISFMMFPVGYYYINSKEKLILISKVLFLVLVIILTNIFFVNLFQIGESDYLEGSIRFGGGRVNITKILIIILFTSPLLLLSLNNNIKKKLIIAIYISALIICLVGVKRSVLISLFIGIFIFIWFSPYKAKIAKHYIIGLILLTLLSPLFIDTFSERLESREERITITEENIEKEGRYWEIMNVMTAMERGNWKHRLFGSDLFNDKNFFKTERPLHIDYMIILNGAGIMGLLGWFAIIYLIILYKIKYFKHLKHDNYFQVLNAIFWAILIAQMIISISGSVYSISFRSYVFLTLGGIIGVMKNNLNPIINQDNKSPKHKYGF